LWDEQLVHDTFNEHDANLILNMPVNADMEDFIAWHFDDKGMHSVKQAYKFQTQIVENLQMGGRSGSSYTVGDLNEDGDDCWHHIWNEPVPPKIQMFFWRVSTNTLALRPNLWR
jgi:hypothetical protein